MPVLVVVGLLATWPAAGQTVIDGDSLRIGAKRYRLNGIDAPETDQVCPDGWPAGLEARRYLEQLVDGKQIRCIRLYGERHGEPFAVCRADGVDLGSAMVVAGQVTLVRARFHLSGNRSNGRLRSSRCRG